MSYLEISPISILTHPVAALIHNRRRPRPPQGLWCAAGNNLLDPAFLLQTGCWGSVMIIHTCCVAEPVRFLMAPNSALWVFYSDALQVRLLHNPSANLISTLGRDGDSKNSQRFP